MANWRASDPSTPTKREGYLLKPDFSLWIGKDAVWGSLETSSTSYSENSVPIGVDHTSAYKLGYVNAAGITGSPSWEDLEFANAPTGSVQDLTGDEATMSVTINEFTPEIVRDMFSNGRAFYGPNPEYDEMVMEFGWVCGKRPRPISIEFLNHACEVPDAEALGSGDATAIYATDAGGISGGTVTLYNAFNTAGFPLDTFSYNEVMAAALEFKAVPLHNVAPFNATSRGKFGSVYLY